MYTPTNALFKMFPFNTFVITDGTAESSLTHGQLAIINAKTKQTVGTTATVDAAKRDGYYFVVAVDTNGDGVVEDFRRSYPPIVDGKSTVLALSGQCYQAPQTQIFVVDGYSLEFNTTYSISVKIMNDELYKNYDWNGFKVHAVYVTEDRIGTANDPDYGKFVIYMKNELIRQGKGLVDVKAYDSDDNELATDAAIQAYAESNAGTDIKMRIFIKNLDNSGAILKINEIYDYEVKATVSLSCSLSGSTGFNQNNVSEEQSFKPEIGNGLRIMYDEFYSSEMFDKERTHLGDWTMIDNYTYLSKRDGKYNTLTYKWTNRNEDLRDMQFANFIAQFACTDAAQINNLKAMLAALSGLEAPSDC